MKDIQNGRAVVEDKEEEEDKSHSGKSSKKISQEKLFDIVSSNLPLLRLQKQATHFVLRTTAGLYRSWSFVRRAVR